MGVWFLSCACENTLTAQGALEMMEVRVLVYLEELVLQESFQHLIEELRS